MKTPEEWFDIWDRDTVSRQRNIEEYTLRFAASIQADALRHAAGACDETRGSLVLADKQDHAIGAELCRNLLESEADKLEKP